MKKLGFGLMRLPLLDPNNDASIDMDQLKKMVDIFIERGFTYFDTAIMYNGFASQRAAKEALVDRYPRDSFTLATKLHSGFFDSFEDRTAIPGTALRWPPSCTAAFSTPSRTATGSSTNSSSRPAQAILTIISSTASRPPTI